MYGNPILIEISSFIGIVFPFIYTFMVAVLNQVLIRAGRDEQAMMTTLAGLVVVLMMVVREIAELFELVKTLFQL